MVASIRLLHAPEERPRFPPIAAGNRSLVFQFDSLDPACEVTNLMAVIEAAVGQNQQFEAEVRFIGDLAELYATKGASFRLWYGGMVGSGHVLRVVSEHDDDAYGAANLRLIPPWWDTRESTRQSVSEKLASEVSEAHPLFGRVITIVGVCPGCSEILAFNEDAFEWIMVQTQLPASAVRSFGARLPFDELETHAEHSAPEI